LFLPGYTQKDIVKVSLKGFLRDMISKANERKFTEGNFRK